MALFLLLVLVVKVLLDWGRVVLFVFFLFFLFFLVKLWSVFLVLLVYPQVAIQNLMCPFSYCFCNFHIDL